MVGRGVAQKNVALYGVSWNYTKMCFKILYFLRVRNWLGPIFSAAIIMIFVSCTNNNEYVRNYQDCLTLYSRGFCGSGAAGAWRACLFKINPSEWPAKLGIRGF
jgi:hypothetical protein